MVPVELSGGTRFPEISDRPYFLNLSPFSFFWFALEKQRTEVPIGADELPVISAKSWGELIHARHRDELTRALLRYVRTRRWFGSKSRTVSSLSIGDVIPIGRDAGSILLLDVEYTEGEPERYLLPVVLKQARRSDEQERATGLIARVDNCVLHEAIGDERFGNALLALVEKRRRVKGNKGVLGGSQAKAFRELRDGNKLHAQVLRAEQSNTAIVYEEQLFLKLFRRLEPGMNTDLEIMTFLNEETPFRNTPRVGGAIEYSSNGHREPSTVAILQSYTPNSGDAWRYTLDGISRFFERVLSETGAIDRVTKATPSEPLLSLAESDPSDEARELVAGYLADAELLGKRTAEMHLALASRSDIPAFAPEPFTPHYQRSIYQSMRSQAVQALQLIRRRAKILPEAEALLSSEQEIHRRLREVLNGRIGGSRIRTHGDYHLGQVLYTGNDFVIIDFEGEPARPLSERRIKRSALRDVAGMLRSFHYAPFAVIFGHVEGSVIRPEDAPALEAAARFWQRWVSASFLRAYLAMSREAAHLPPSRDELRVLLNAYLFEKALYEIVYELNNRPAWVRIPIRGVLDLLT
jgi:maltose alpha-D-glucosyltransferase / alpha-amylase